MPHADGMALTRKQERFAEEYLIDLNATQAAIRAGYSPKTADRVGPRLVGKSCVAEAIRAGQKKTSERSALSVQRVLDELTKIGFSNISDILDFDQDGVTVRDSRTLPPAVLASISEISTTVNQHGTNIKVKLHPKLTAIETICKILGFFNEDGKERKPEEVARLVLDLLRLAGPNR